MPNGLGPANRVEQVGGRPQEAQFVETIHLPDELDVVSQPGCDRRLEVFALVGLAHLRRDPQRHACRLGGGYSCVDPFVGVHPTEE